MALIVLLPAGLLRAAEEPVAVLSQVFNGYARVHLPDKSFKPERYTFGEGGSWTRPVDDPAMDKLKFLDVARVVAGPLQRLNYLPAQTAEEAELLILVFWGSTQGSRSSDPSQAVDRAGSAMALYNNLRPMESGQTNLPDAAGNAAAVESTLLGQTGSPESRAAEAAADSALWQLGIANDERDRLDDRNARIVGYTESLERARFIPHMAMGQDVFAEVGDNRYFIVLQAYDFRTAVKEKRLKPLWFARISVRERGKFARVLERMAWSASRFFGQDSGGLHRYETIPEGKTEIGPLQIIEVVEPKKAEGDRPSPGLPPADKR